MPTSIVRNVQIERFIVNPRKENEVNKLALGEDYKCINRIDGTKDNLLDTT